MSWEDMSMIEEYFSRTEYYKKKYGENTIVLMQAGSFLEVYGYSIDNTKELIGSNIKEFSEICEMQISVKSGKYKENTIHMAGFRDYSESRYVKKLVDKNYTVVVIHQDDEMQKTGAKKKIRFVSGVYSPGTYVQDEIDTDNRWSNNLMCIWIETIIKNRINKIIIGMSVINIIDGHTFISEYEINDTKIQPTDFDELNKNLSVYNPKEIILVCDNDYDNYIMENKSYYIHKYKTNDVVTKNACQQTYQKSLIEKLFGEDSLTKCNEYIHNEIATQSLCVMINFIEEHNPQVLKNVKNPLWENKTGTMILANNSLRQLNILNDNSEQKSNLSSVHKWLNKCKTIMGKRLFLYTITHPTYNTEVLTKEYSIMEKILNDPHEMLIEEVRKELDEIYDIDSISRLLLTKKITLTHMYKLFKSIFHSRKVLEKLSTLDYINEYLELSNDSKILNECKDFIEFIERRININECLGIGSLSSTDLTIIKEGNYYELDNLIKDNRNLNEKLNDIRTFWERKMSNTSKVGEYVKINRTDKNRISLQMTKLRCDTLKKNMKGKDRKDGSDDIVLGDIRFRWSDVSFVLNGKTNMDIKFPECDDICKKLGEYQTNLNELNNKIYVTIIEEIIKKYYVFFEKISKLITKLDVLFNKCYVSRKYSYVKPTIEKKEKSYVKAKQMRHILIEQLNENEIYVPNDLNLGLNNEDGKLIFGTNAVGKTSFMKSLGICIVLAQCGMYVPCESFVYHPYESLYTRIVNQDNLFKGMSTFEVEMSELRVIIRYANKNSLILGDELCSGTETTSALCIMMSSLINLSEKEASFLFATHFHEILNYEELENLKNISLHHLAVEFNNELDCLVYERKLKPGAGPCNYGLEVCKSLYLDSNFLERAYFIRKKYYPKFEGTLNASKSIYNSKKIKGKCEICGEEGNDIHHLEEQNTANNNGIINNHFHKNHCANLINICNSCHKKEHHNNENPIKKKKKTIKGTKLMSVKDLDLEKTKIDIK
jgi:DNA mismatch repair protein MutS